VAGAVPGGGAGGTGRALLSPPRRSAHSFVPPCPFSLASVSRNGGSKTLVFGVPEKGGRGGVERICVARQGNESTHPPQAWARLGQKKADGERGKQRRKAHLSGKGEGGRGGGGGGGGFKAHARGAHSPLSRAPNGSQQERGPGGAPRVRWMGAEGRDKHRTRWKKEKQDTVQHGNLEGKAGHRQRPREEGK
jgi:hypothetical protein